MALHIVMGHGDSSSSIITEKQVAIRAIADERPSQAIVLEAVNGSRRGESCMLKSGQNVQR
jgi:hypothetical protein